jgi:deoxycytidine triphosphate deaminase
MPSLTEKRRAEANRLRSYCPLNVDPHPTIHGVLLRDEITFYAENHHLIYPFDPDNLHPAGYELTVGDEYFLSGEFHSLASHTPDGAKLTIPPFEVAVLKTGELVCLPRFLIARWNIRVKHAYSGLLWVGGPQVDPGYVGHLFCPIYNLSDKPVTLRLAEPLALMDFVKTTPFDDNTPDRLRYSFPPKRVIIEDYGIDELRSALFTRAGEKLVEFETTIKNIEARFLFFTQLSFTIFALVIGLVSLISRTGADSVLLSTSVWGGLVVGLSVAAILIAFFSYVQARMERLVADRYGRLIAIGLRKAQLFIRCSCLSAVVLSVLVAVSLGIVAYIFSEPFFRDIRQHRVLTISDLDAFRGTIREDVEREIERLRVTPTPGQQPH